MSDRPIDDGVEGLRDVHDQVSGDTEALADLLRNDMEAIRRLMSGAGAGGTSQLSAELDAVTGDMLRAVSGLGDDLGSAIASEADQLDRLRRPAGPAPSAQGTQPPVVDSPESATGRPAVISVYSASSDGEAVLRTTPTNSDVWCW